MNPSSKPSIISEAKLFAPRAMFSWNFAILSPNVVSLPAVFSIDAAISSLDIFLALSFAASAAPDLPVSTDIAS